jgi:hypothetical protein
VVDAHHRCSPKKLKRLGSLDRSSGLKEMGTNHDKTPFPLPNDSFTLLNKEVNDKTAHIKLMLIGDDVSTSEGGNETIY